MKSLLYSPTYSGLANRLRGLAGYQAMARCLGLAFQLCWVPNQDCDARFEQLFDPAGFTIISAADRERRRQDPDVAVFEDRPTFGQLWSSHLRGMVAWEEFSSQALACLRGLRPIEHIDARVRVFSESFGLARTPGVHIRWTDNLQAYDNWASTGPGFDPQRISQLEGFERFIDQYLATDDKSNVFLATDNAEVQDRFTTLFGSRLVVYPKRYRRALTVKWDWRRLTRIFSVQRTSSIQDALVELLLLAECRLLVGTYYSSYADIAALRGGKPLMRVHGDRCVEETVLPAPDGGL